MDMVDIMVNTDHKVNLHEPVNRAARERFPSPYLAGWNFPIVLTRCNRTVSVPRTQK